MLASRILTEEETTVDPELGYPRGYAKLCRNANLQMQNYITPYNEGPPQIFLPYALQPADIAKVKELNQLFPIIESGERDPSSARRFADSLWLQLDHLGNAGFDPALFRIDHYGNVLYKNADPASPLAWEVDHWFPHSRGGKTVSSNLRLVQWQVNQRKKNKLEFLVPWWDLQLGISVNQFLLIFLSKNSDFRQRAFSLLFFAGENEPFTELLVADCHSWPQHFHVRKSQIGLAPASIVRIHNQTNDALKPQNGTPGRRRWTKEEEEALRRAIQRFGPGNWKEIKENEPLFRNKSTVQIKDKYRLVKEDWELKENKREYLPGKELILSTAIQKESRLKKTGEEEIQRKAEEISQMNKELKELQQQNEAECLVLEDLETVLIKHKRRLEKHRRWSEAQSSYRMCLEKMITDTMHQSVVYKEQGRLNQAACNALMARLEMQKAACDASEMDLLKRLKQREDLEKLLPHSEQVGMKLHEDNTANCPKNNIRLEETHACFYGATQCPDSAIIAVDGLKEGSDTYGATETSLPQFENKEECPKILQDLRLSAERKQLEDKSNMSLVTLNDQDKTGMDTPKAEVLPAISLRNPVKTEGTREKRRLSEAEQSDLDVLFVGYEYEGSKGRGREEESVGENMTFVTTSLEFKHSNFEGWSKGDYDCASRIGENDDLNKHYMLAEEDRDCKPVEDRKFVDLLDDGSEMERQTKTAIPDAAAEKGTEEDEAIKTNGKSNLDKWLQMLLLNPESKENVETENLPQIHDNFSATQVCETNHSFEGQTMNLSFREQPPIHRKTSFAELEKKEHVIHENPRCASTSCLMVNESLDLIEKFKFLQLDGDDQKDPQSKLVDAPNAGLELQLEGNGKSIMEDSTAVRESEGAMLDSGTEVQHEKVAHNNFNQLKDGQIGTEMPLKDNPGYTSEIREPEGISIRSDKKEDSMSFEGQESRLKRSDSIGYLSNAYSAASLWGMQCKGGQSKGRIEEEGKIKAAKFTEEGQQGLALLKNGLTASIKTCTHMWKKLLKD